MQKVREVRIDCDADAILLKVEQVGGIACHTGRESCFFRKLENGKWVTIGSGAQGSRRSSTRNETRTSTRRWSASRAAINERKGGDPAKSYVAKLFAQGDDAMLKKIGEEATETVLAAKSGDRLHLVREVTDLWFHCMIVLARHGLGPGDVLAEMQRREGISGLDEKAARKK